MTTSTTATQTGWVRQDPPVTEIDGEALANPLGAVAYGATWDKPLTDGTVARITRWYYVAQRPDEDDPHLSVQTDFLVISRNSGQDVDTDHTTGLVTWADRRVAEAMHDEDVPVTDDGARQLAESAAFDEPCDDEWYWVLPDETPDLVGAAA